MWKTIIKWVLGPFLGLVISRGFLGALHKLNLYPDLWIEGLLVNTPGTLQTEFGWIFSAVLALLLIIAWHKFNLKEKFQYFGREKPIGWVYLKDAVDYLTYDAKFALPTKNRPMEAFIFMSAKMIEMVARDRQIQMRGRKKDALEFEVLDPDFWRLAHFDWEALMKENGRQAGKTDDHPSSDISDRPVVPVYVDLEVNKTDLQRMFPPQNRWDKSKIGKWLRNTWVGMVPK